MKKKSLVKILHFDNNFLFIRTGEQVLGIMKNIGPQQWFILSGNAAGQSTNLTVSDEEGLTSQPWVLIFFLVLTINTLFKVQNSNMLTIRSLYF
ncbi:MAG: hypothetical protein M1365_05255 [Actinobacteria bacterium]|nr:hypothetical protein [Actinomycetota bacterium]